jgi:small-conductance mechanosensitive channel
MEMGNLMAFLTDSVGLITIAFTMLSILLTALGVGALARVEYKRINEVREMEVTEAVETDSPQRNLVSQTKKIASNSIRERFRQMKRALVFTVFTAWLIVMLAAFLPGISSSYITLIAGITVLLVGMICRPIVENFVAGLVITFSQPIRIGDTIVIDGHYGTVERINILNTVIKVWNWKRYIIPNAKLVQKEIENLTITDEYEWVHVSFWVSPDSDMALVKQLAIDAMTASDYLESVESPSFWVMDMEKDSIECWVAGWATSPANAWELKSDTRENLFQLLRENGVKYHSIHLNIVNKPPISA